MWYILWCENHQSSELCNLWSECYHNVLIFIFCAHFMPIHVHDLSLVMLIGCWAQKARETLSSMFLHFTNYCLHVVTKNHFSLLLGDTLRWTSGTPTLFSPLTWKFETNHMAIERMQELIISRPLNNLSLCLFNFKIYIYLQFIDFVLLRFGAMKYTNYKLNTLSYIDNDLCILKHIKVSIYTNPLQTLILSWILGSAWEPEEHNVVESSFDRRRLAWGNRSDYK